MKLVELDKKLHNLNGKILSRLNTVRQNLHFQFLKSLFYCPGKINVEI